MTQEKKYLLKGDNAPDFNALDYKDQEVNLKNILKEGNVFLVFIRGFG